VRVFKILTYVLDKRNDLPTVFAAALNAADVLSPGKFKKYFYLADSENGKISAVERAVKKHPVLTKYMYSIPDRLGKLAEHRVLSNMTDDWAPPNPNKIHDEVGPDVLLAIADGIPKTFPFMYATFVLDRIDWFKTGTFRSPANHRHKASPYSPSDVRDYFSSSIIFQSKWGYSRRELTLHAVIELDPPAGAGSLPDVDSTVQDLLGSLGRIRNARIMAIASPEEEETLDGLALRANEVVNSYQQSLDEILSGVQLPHVLVEPSSFCSSWDNVSAKKPLANTFKGAGYRYLNNMSGQGLYFLCKRTERNNEILLVFDLAPMARTLSWNLVVQGPLWRHTLRMKFYPKTHEQFSIAGQETLDQLVENARGIALSLEDAVVKDLEDIYGSAPGWFLYRE